MQLKPKPVKKQKKEKGKSYEKIITRFNSHQPLVRY